MLGYLGLFFSSGTYGILLLLAYVGCILISGGFHEFAHAWMAHKLGDDTAKFFGRLTPNPLKHIDIIGFISLLIFGYGWFKPVPFNPRNLRGNPKSASTLVAFAGPLSNFILAFLAMAIAKILIPFLSGSLQSFFAMIFVEFVSLNVGLAIFNLVPIPPLDGSKVLNSLLPAKLYFGIMQYEFYGSILLIILLQLPIFQIILSQFSRYVVYFFAKILNFTQFYTMLFGR
jgi:Zn-dependent protease